MLCAYCFFKGATSDVYVHIYKQLITPYSSSTPVFSSMYFCDCTVPADPLGEFKSMGGRLIYKAMQPMPFGVLGEMSRSHRNLCVPSQITVACTEREVPRSKERLA